jgi:RHS repeat-associated protein
MTLPPNTTSIVAYMKYESGTEVYFDDLKIEITDKPVAMVVQENHYYPFGLGMKGLDYVAPSPNVENKFTFNGQTEKETKLGLNWHETAFRRYDPQLGRFHQIDPLADLFTGITPFQFGYNNPVLFNDPTGLEAEEWKPRYIGSDPCKPCQEKKSQLEGTSNFGSLLAGVEKPNSTTSQYESYRNKKSYPGSAGQAGVPIKQSPIVKNIPLSGGISPKTFDWQKVTDNWRAIGVTNLVIGFWDVNTKPPKPYKIIKFEIEVGTPIYFFNRDTSEEEFVNPEMAKQYAAKSANTAATYIMNNKSLPFTHTQAEIPKLFAKYMEAELQSYVPGSRVNTPIVTKKLRTVSAIYETGSFFDKLMKYIFGEDDK